MEKLTKKDVDGFPIAPPLIGIQHAGIPRRTGYPVLAVIESQSDLGRSEWHEVVYYDGDLWCSYEGSKTFDDGEKVLRWIYATEAV